MTEFDPGAASQPVAQLAAVSGLESRGAGFAFRVGAAGVGFAAAAFSASMIESAFEAGTATAAESTVSFTTGSVTHDCSTGEISLNVALSGSDLGQGKVLNLIPKTLPSLAPDWHNKEISTTADSENYLVVFSPEASGDTLSNQSKEEIIEVDELAADNNTWIPNVASHTIKVPGCLPEVKPTATHTPKPSHSTRPTVAPTQSNRPSPTQIPSLKPLPTKSVILVPPTPSQTVEAVAPSAPIAPPVSSELLPDSSNPVSSTSDIESSPANSQLASSGSAENSQSAPPSGITLGNSGGSGSSGGNTLPGVVWGILGAGVLGSVGLGIRHLLHKPNPGQPQTPRPV